MIAISLLGFILGFVRIPRIMPSNYFGCLRYTQSVNENTRRSDYQYSSEELQARPFPPLASIATVLIALGVSLWLGLAANYWPPFVFTAVMFLAASFPPRSWGPLATSCIEVVFSGGLLWVLFSVS